MKLVSYNIQYGFGSDGRYDLARAAKVVAGADIIALQEVERFWQRSNEDDQPAILGRLLPDHYWVYGPAFDMDASFRERRPHRQPPPAVRHHDPVAPADRVVAPASPADAPHGRRRSTRRTRRSNA